MSTGLRPQLTWAPDIPPEWDVVRLRWIARIFAGGTPDRANLEFWTDGTIPWLNSGAVNDVIIHSPSALITEAALAAGATRWAPAGSVLVALAGQGRTKGMAARLQLDSTLNQSMAAIVPGATIDQRYLHYWLTSNYLNLRGLTGSDLRDGLNLQHIGSVQVPSPPLARQRAIADFLDRETAQIDALIHKQAQLITLLRERRQSIIDEAFTVDDGRIPTRVRRLLAVRPSYGVLVPQYVDDDQEGVPLIRVGDLTSLDIESGSLLSISEEQSAEYSRTRLAGGEVLLGVVGKMGQAAVVPRWLAGANVARAVCVLRCRSHLASALLAEWLGSTHFLHQASEATSGDTIQPTLGMADLGRFTVNWPQDEVEGRRMAKYLEERTTAVDGLIAKAKELGELARERRAALISAAVTGKIDVGVSA